MNTVTDGQLGQLAVKQHELFQRAKKGVYGSFDEMLDALQQIIEGKAPTIPTLTSFTSYIFHLTVDYNLSLEQMIVAGQYGYTNSDITAKRFSIRGNDIVEYEASYFHFNRSISSEDAMKEIEQAGWSPAKIEHVLSHGKTFPEEQRKFPIIGLGSVAEIRGARGVPCLGRNGSRRDLDLLWFGSVWNVDSRFPAIRKISGA